jgi:hypothetical protein
VRTCMSAARWGEVAGVRGADDDDEGEMKFELLFWRWNLGGQTSILAPDGEEPTVYHPMTGKRIYAFFFPRLETPHIMHVMPGALIMIFDKTSKPNSFSCPLTSSIPN